MIGALIFSKDRACQLRLLLESIERQAPDAHDRLAVLFDFSSTFYLHGYAKLMEDAIARQVLWICQKPHAGTPRFKKFVMDAVDDGASDYIQFLCDDSVIFGPLTGDEGALVDGDVLCFSPRLGLNITYSYSYDAPTALGEHEEQGDVVLWRWWGAGPDFDYPLTIDGNIYRKDTILSLLDQVVFDSPPRIDGRLTANRKRALGWRRMAAYRHSRLVSVPVNRVQNVYTNNRFAKREGTTQAALNRAYLAGHVIDYDALDFSTINSPHVPLVLSLC